ELLLSKGASVKAQDKKGRTPLLLAASYGDHPEVVKVLLAGEADVQAKDGKARTALDLAEARGYTKAAQALRDGGAVVTPPGQTALRTPRQAAEASLMQVEGSMKTFAKRTGCVSCHHQGIASFAMGFALKHGYSVDKLFAQEQQKRVLGAAEEMR